MTSKRERIALSCMQQSKLSALKLLGEKNNNTCSSSSSQSLFSLDCNARRPDLQQRQQQHALIRNKQYLPEGGFILVNTFMHMKIWYIIVRAENIPPQRQICFVAPQLQAKRADQNAQNQCQRILQGSFIDRSDAEQRQNVGKTCSLPILSNSSIQQTP